MSTNRTGRRMKKVVLGVGLAAGVVIGARRIVHDAAALCGQCTSPLRREPHARADDVTGQLAVESSTSGHGCACWPCGVESHGAVPV